jgi:hypothetical protein
LPIGRKAATRYAAGQVTESTFVELSKLTLCGTGGAAVALGEQKRACGDYGNSELPHAFTWTGSTSGCLTANAAAIRFAASPRSR